MQIQIPKKVQQFLNQDKDIGELIQKSSGAFALKIANVAFVYLFNWLIIKFAGVEGNGNFSFCYTALNIFSTICKLGFDTYLVRQIARHSIRNDWQYLHEVYRKTISYALIASIFFGIGLFLFADLLAVKLNIGTYEEGLKVVALAILPSTVLALNAESLRGLKAINLYSLLQHVVVFILGCLLVLVVHQFYSQKEIGVYAILGGFILTGGWSFYLLRSLVPEPRHEKVQVSNREIFRSAFPMLMSSAIFFLMNWTDRIMLGFMVPEGDLGVYEIASKVANLATMTLMVINSVAAPMISDLYSNKSGKDLENFIRRTAFIAVVLNLPIFIILFTVPSFLLSLFDKQIAIHGVQPLTYLVIGHVFNTLTGPCIFLLNMTGHEKTSQNVFLSAGILNFVLNFLLIPKLGIDGAAIATMFATIFWNMLAVFFVYRYFKFLTLNYRWK